MSTVNAPDDGDGTGVSSPTDDDLPVVERAAVRLVVLDANGRLLLLHITEPLHPDQAPCWELPGGGIDADETLAEAARRELLEETGLEVGPSAVGAPSWCREVTFRHAGTRRVQTERVVPVRLAASAPAVDPAGQLADEAATLLGWRWWTVSEIEASKERFYPRRLPELLRRLLDGELIDEPFEHFS